MKHPQFIHLLSGAGRTCPGPISYHAAACPSRGGQWRGLVSHSGVKAEVLLGAAVGESANSKYIIYIYIYIYIIYIIYIYILYIWDDVKWPPNGWLLDFGLLLWVYHFTAVSLKIKFQTSDWYVYMPMRSKSTNMYMHTSACAFTRHNIYIYTNFGCPCSNSAGTFPSFSEEASFGGSWFPSCLVFWGFWVGKPIKQSIREAPVSHL